MPAFINLEAHKEQIVSLYQSAKGCPEICQILQSSFGITVKTCKLWSQLKRWQVITRSRECQRYTILSNEQKDIIDGMLLGDGSLRTYRKTPQIVLTSIHREYVDFLNTLLPIKTRIAERRLRQKVMFDNISYDCKPSFELVSVSDKVLFEFCKRWLYLRHKIIPNDLTFTPTMIRHWFYGDGSTSFLKRKNRKIQNSTVHLTFCTNAFTEDECHQLCYQFEKIDSNLKFFVNHTQKGQPIIKTTRQAAINTFFDYIGDCEISCFDYKWKRPITKYMVGAS
jgi:hypothetical protein